VFRCNSENKMTLPVTARHRSNSGMALGSGTAHPLFRPSCSPFSSASTRKNPRISHGCTRIHTDKDQWNILTQAQAAKIMGITQPRVSNLMSGRLHVFSVDTLIALLARLGLRVAMKA
jgi:hypothetical protein